MRQVIKSVSTKLEKFIPKSHAADPELSETAKEIKDRPMVFMWRKLTREDRYNISSLIRTDITNDEVAIQNLGTLARYIWEHCVAEVHNVLLEAEALECVKGVDKDRLFNTEGMDNEIAEVIRHVQENSSLSDAEAKN